MTTKQPLNQILYGPPGTGKTYNTIYKALDILEPKVDGESWANDDTKEGRKKALEKFNEYKKKEQIVMTTFHQSMGYEDFIEGIKPEIPKDSNGKEKELVLYKNSPGIFKNLVKECNKSIENFKQQHGNGDIIDRFYSYAAGLNLEFKMSRGGMFRIVDGKINSSTATDREFDNLKDILKLIIPLIDFCKDYQPIDITELLKVSNVKKTTGTTDQRSSYIAPIVNELKSFRNSLKEEKYVLIIDEINRGNVANIFGEMITLIEDEKRTTKWDEANKTYVETPEGVKVKLPYSGDEFGVPGNLYIIGTMNTADRSVEALDSALRRRFSFTEMMPKPGLLKCKGRFVEINGTGHTLADLLYTINKRIEVLKDREHQIGHSYFMKFLDKEKVNAEDLKDVFYNKIIPLLQEYFYGDYEKIKMVLSGEFVRLSPDTNNIFNNIKGEDPSFEVPYQLYDVKDMKNAIDSMALLHKYPVNTPTLEVKDTNAQ